MEKNQSKVFIHAEQRGQTPIVVNRGDRGQTPIVGKDGIRIHFSMTMEVSISGKT